ncbi:hypothetical protein HOY80DRAFT_1063182 [Tuber brumale]|nr:hypothetical protein HOY80DRAFT_1063182 [Tuber brumale]
MPWRKTPATVNLGAFQMDYANSTSNSIVTPTAESTEQYAAYTDMLTKNWYYNETLHLDFISIVTPGAGISTATISCKAMKSLDGLSLAGLLANTLYKLLVHGMVELSILRRVRNSRLPKMDVVLLYSGSEGVNRLMASKSLLSDSRDLYIHRPRSY